ncbi:unnamed protein product [Acanthosepion pharaonis]|uniref:Uncharacterized protein n=1 Tax=Acanthosepion pharaonis TaxID=158019 RepID=A0A812BLP1_ACAPH|nr:unnamed protein product [Sepia pharaonis]
MITSFLFPFISLSFLPLSNHSLNHFPSLFPTFSALPSLSLSRLSPFNCHLPLTFFCFSSSLSFSRFLLPLVFSLCHASFFIFLTSFSLSLTRFYSSVPLSVSPLFFSPSLRIASILLSLSPYCLYSSLPLSVSPLFFYPSLGIDSILLSLSRYRIYSSLPLSVSPLFFSPSLRIASILLSLSP